MKLLYKTLTISLISTCLLAQDKTVTFQVQKPVDTEEELVLEEFNPDRQIFFVVEEMPQFPGGQMALRQFLTENVIYPEEAREKDIEGRVYVQFIVSETGRVVEVKVVRGAHPLLNAAALQVVRSIPNFTPGRQRGQAVAVSFTVPINFILPD